MASEHTEHNALEVLRTRLYRDLLQSLVLEDASLQNVLLDITLGTVLTGFDSPEYYNTRDPGNSNDASEHHESTHERREALTKQEILRYGTPARHLLNDSSRQRLLDEVQTILRSITNFFYGDIGEDPPNGEEMESQSQLLPETIQLQKADIESLKQEVKTLSYRLTDLMMEIAKTSKNFDEDLKQATDMVFPIHDAARTASIDLLAAAIESSLIKLSLTRARSERALYNYHTGYKTKGEGRNVAQAIATAFGVLKKEERDMKIENQSLDRQLEEYETLLSLVDGENGGYQQIISDWTKVKQETDECLKDLRCLGWTGD